MTPAMPLLRVMIFHPPGVMKTHGHTLMLSSVFSFLKGMHLNDSKKGLGSRVDRHASIGKGEIGLDAFQRIMEDTRLDNIPMILETPDNAIWAEEIALLKGFVR